MVHPYVILHIDLVDSYHGVLWELHFFDPNNTKSTADLIKTLKQKHSLSSCHEVLKGTEMQSLNIAITH